jgi:hypothetical protein
MQENNARCLLLDGTENLLMTWEAANIVLRKLNTEKKEENV